MYAIVEFQCTEEATKNEISIVPYIWVVNDDTRCYWPLSTSKLSFVEFVRKETPHRKTWPKYKLTKVHFKTGIIT